MLQNVRRMCIIAILVLLHHTVFSQTSWTGEKNTNWNSASNWSNGVPNASTDAIIGDAAFVGPNAPTVNVAANCKSLTIGGSTAQTLTLKKNLVINGNLLILANGTLSQPASTITLKGNWTNNGSYNSTNSNAKIVFGGTAQLIGGSALTTFRQVTINTGATVTLAANTAVGGSGSYLYVYGTLNPNESPTYKLTSTGSFQVFNNGKIKVNADLFATNYALSGSVNLSAGSIVDYSSTTVNQTISAAYTYSTLLITGSGTKSLAANLPALAATASNAGYINVSSGTLDLSTYTANRGTSVAGGELIINNNALLRIGGTSNFPVNFAVRTLALGSTVEYYTANQNVSAESYGNLILSGNAGSATKTFPSSAFTIEGNFTSRLTGGTSLLCTTASDVTINGTVNIGAGTTFNASGNTHTFRGNFINNGIFTGGTSTVTFEAPSISISGSGSQNFNNVNINRSGITATGSINVSGNFATNGSGEFSHAAPGVFTMTGTAKTLTGIGIDLYDLAVTGSISSTADVIVNGNISVSGTLTGTAGVVLMKGSGKSITGTGTKTFSTLQVTGSVTTAVNFGVATLLDVSGSFSASAGTATFTGVSQLSGTANLYNAAVNGTSFQLNASSVLGIAGNFTITAGIFNATTAIPNTINYNGTGAQTITATTYHHLSLSNGNTKTAAGGITVNGNINIASSTTFAAGSYTHSILRNWINNGSFTAGSSTIQFTGANNASVTGATSFNNITINKTASSNTVSLNNDITTAVVNMTNGSLLTGSNKITITSTRTGNGIILGTITRAHNFYTGLSYAFESPENSVWFVTAIGVTSVTVVVKQGNVDDFPNNAAINREYNLSISATLYVATLRLHYEDAELNGANEQYLDMWRNPSGSWSNVGRTTYNTSSNYVEIVSLGNLAGRWTLSQSPGVVRWNGSVSTAWENAANWTSVSGGGSTPPSATDIVQIGTASFNYDPVIASAATARSISFGSAKAAALSLTSGGSLTVSGNVGGTWTADAVHTINTGSQNLTVNGNLNLGNGVNNRCVNLYIGNGTVQVAGSLLQNANAGVYFSSTGNLKIGDSYNYISGAFAPANGTVTYQGSSAQAVSPLSYYNLVVNKTGGVASLSAPLNVAGSLSITSGTLDVTSADVTVAGNVAIGSAGVLDCDMVNIFAGGNWTNNGSYIFTSGTVTLNGTGTQTISGGAFNNLVINKSAGVVALAGNNALTGNFSLLSGSVNLGTYTLNRTAVGGNFSMSANTSLQAAGTNNFPSNFSVNNLHASSTVLYDGVGAQTIRAITYGNLQVSNGGSNPKTLTGTTPVLGDISINSNATLQAASYPIQLSGNWTNSGTFVPGTGSVIVNGTAKTITGNTTFNRLTINGSYTVAGSNINYNGTLTINATGSFVAGSGVANVNGDLINSGSLTSTGTTNFTGTTLQTIRLLNAIASTSTGIINFNGTVAPVLNSTSSPQYANLNINNTAGINPSVDWVIYGAMTIAAGASFNGGMSTHTLYGNFTNAGTVTSNGRLNFLPTSAKTIAMGNSGFTSNGVVNLGGSGQLTLSGTPGSIKSIIISNTNTAGVTAPSNWTIDSNFVVTSAAKFLAGGNTISVGGNIESDGILDGGTSTFISTGSASELTASSQTLFHHLTVNGSLTPQTDFSIDGDFTNNGVYNGSIGTLVMGGAASASIGGSTVPSPIAQLTIDKASNGVVTQNVNVSELMFLNVNNGILHTSTKTTTQDAGGGFMFVNSGATLRVGGTNTLPAFAAISLDPNSTVEYAGANTTQLIANSADYGHLLISGLGSKNAYAALTILGNLTISNGTLNTNTVTVSHSVAGNFSMTGGTLAGTNSTYILNGDSNQVVSLLSPLIRLRINKSNGQVNLGSNVTVNLTTTFTAGKLATGNYKLIVPNGGSVVGAGQSSGWVIGNLQKNISTGSSVSRTYELGGTNYYTPATLLFATVSAAGDVTGKVGMNDHPAASWSMIDTTKSVNRHWIFSNVGTAFTTADLTMNWVASDLDAGVNTNNLKVAAYDGTDWTLSANNIATATSVTATGLTAMKEYALGEHVSGYLWTGNALTNDWFTGKNWSGGVPSINFNTTIPSTLGAGRVYPVLATSNGMVKDITIQAGASLVVNGSGNLRVAGTITNNGTLNIAQGSAEFIGSTSQTITAGMFTGNKVKDLIISNNVTLQVKDTLTGTLTVANGKTFTTNDNLILRSDSAGTARVAALPVNGSGVATAFITGKVTLERYIPMRKAWRLLSAPVKAGTAPTINAAWQEGLTTAAPNANLYPGYGTMIQGGTVANGFDQGLTANPSIKVFNNTAGNFVALPASGTYTSITNYPGYFIFIRGDRSVSPMAGANATPTKTTLRIKGEINSGSVTTAVNAKGYTVFGNPYASAIDFATLTRSNVKNTFYLWDPKLAGNYGYGAYVTVSYNTSTGMYDVTTAASPVSQYIPSGEAVLIQSADGVNGGTITVKESDKTANGSDKLFGRTNGLMQQVRVNLHAREANGNTTLLDGVLTTYDIDNSNNIDEEDAGKLNGSGENIGLNRFGQMLSIERRETISKADTTFLNLYQLKVQNYQLEIIANNMDANGLIAVVKDSYSNTINNTPLNTNGTTLIDFAVNTDPASYALNRFSIVFAPAVVLPVSFNSISARRVQKEVDVDWSVSSEMNVKHYEIERSADGRLFSVIGTKSTSGNGNNAGIYRFIDSMPFGGNNFYRIRSVDLGGNVQLSKVAKVSGEVEVYSPSVNIYPNPVAGSTASIRMNYVKEGNYQVGIYGQDGNLLQTALLYHDGSSQLQKINLTPGMPAGKYELRITGDHISINSSLIKL